jgi:hypothetical protein
MGIAIQQSKPYKVYTALLTQSGGDTEDSISAGTLTVGVTYTINQESIGMDFTNVGAPNNNIGTAFVATGTTPNSWGAGATYTLAYSAGAPVVTVLENAIGNIYWTYNTTGSYFGNLSFMSPDNSKVVIFMGSNNNDFATTGGRVFQYYYSNPVVQIATKDDDTNSNSNGILCNTPIEIRVYN